MPMKLANGKTMPDALVAAVSMGLTACYKQGPTGACAAYYLKGMGDGQGNDKLPPYEVKVYIAALQKAGLADEHGKIANATIEIANQLLVREGTDVYQVSPNGERISGQGLVEIITNILGRGPKNPGEKSPSEPREI